jgi:hypothetical protein
MILLLFATLLMAAYIVFRKLVRRDYLIKGRLTWLSSLLHLLIFAALMCTPYLYIPPRLALVLETKRGTRDMELHCRFRTDHYGLHCRFCYHVLVRLAQSMLEFTSSYNQRHVTSRLARVLTLYSVVNTKKTAVPTIRNGRRTTSSVYSDNSEAI